MPSESVWFEQVDVALVNHIKSIVKLPNSSGKLVSVPVTIRKPDEDFKIESYPSITIYNLYSKRDEIRYYPDRVITSKDPQRAKCIEESSAIPYNLFYQIDFWAKLQSQMNDMTRLWLGSCPDKYFNLPLKDMSGIDRNSFVCLTDDLKKSDLLDGDKRLFHSILTYKVWVELDERIGVEKPLITQVEISD